MKFQFFKITILVLLVSFFYKTSFSQCINTFPNIQDFESAATWTSGGANSDWAWGTPTKAVISAAGGGAKCWIIGGLTGANYNGSQQSYIVSPCYDFSNLMYPTISFKVFWETEYHYDGANLQYSINNGAWQMIGSSGEASSCSNQNWFNYGGVNFLGWTGNKSGWSGNSQPNGGGGCQGGSGSLGWVISKHCLVGLAGKNNVRFRFTFGSGQTCNGFDGFAIDDFTVQDAVASPVTFTNTCTNFTSISSACSNSLNYIWNFGDLASGANNTSTLTNPSHVFTNPGVYTVSLSTTGGPCGAKTSFTKTVSILGSSISAQSDVTCKGGSNGAATVSALFGNTNLSYTWTPKGGNSASTNILSAGLYSVYVSDANGCLSTSTVNINEPNSSTGASSQTVISCLGNAATLGPTITGISDPITYSWTPGGSTASAINVISGSNTTYTLTLTISGACPKIEQKIYTNIVVPKPTLLFTNSNSMGCSPLCIDFTDNSTTTSGSITSTFWQFTDGISTTLQNPTVCFSKPGVYKASHGVVNSYGCSNFKDTILTITVLPTPIADFIADKNDFTDLEETTVNFKDASTANPNKWEWNFSGLKKDTTKNASFNFSINGVYPIILNVTNEFGCTASVTHTINVLPEFTFYAPNSFSPNNDNINDVFIPIGRGWEASSYKLAIYDRWGKKMFGTEDVNQGWDGKVNASDNFVEEGTYIYKAEVNDSSKKLHSYVGHITVIK
ncbi:MAG: PKD domain-containing protein [Bacteroidota bacterium]|nr:PKD domain-containing protein [Bacteroidota bacterium]